MTLQHLPGISDRWQLSRKFSCQFFPFPHLLNLPLDVWGTGSAKAMPRVGTPCASTSTPMLGKDPKKWHLLCTKNWWFKIPLLLLVPLEDSILDTRLRRKSLGSPGHQTPASNAAVALGPRIHLPGSWKSAPPKKEIRVSKKPSCSGSIC